jgi:PKHD-type hydroxylase
MFLVVEELLSREELAACRSALAALPWEDGRRTAGRMGQDRKSNSQLPTELFAQQRREILDRLMQHPEVRRRVYPARALAPVLNRYRTGDRYDWHNDNPVQSGLRADVSYTMFLSEPSEYEGGELIVRTPDEDRSFKLPAGAAVFYESAALHCVQPIRSGERLAAIGWVQSLVREPRDREVLALVKACLQRLESERELFGMLATVEAELGRRWVEPA